MRLSTFIIGVLLVGLLVTIISLFIVDIGDNYGKIGDVNKLNTSTYNQIQQLSDQSNTTRAQISNIAYSSADMDILGRLFGGSWNALKTTLASVDLSLTIADEAFNGVNETGGVSSGAGTQTIKGFLIAALVIFIFVGILLSILLNREV